MNKPTKMLIDIRRTVVKHGPEILTGLGIAGMITGTVLAVKATPKAMQLIEEAKNEKEELAPIDIVRVAWKPYLPVLLVEAASVACLIGASSVSLRRNAALATAYKLSEAAYTEYRDKVTETFGEKKSKDITDKIAEDRLRSTPVNENDIFDTKTGNTLFLDPTSGRYFMSDIDRIRRAENILNKQMNHDICGYVSLNDFYDEIGLDHIDIGDDLGWNLDRGLIDVEFSSFITDKDRPCIVISHAVPPIYNFECF